MQHRLRDHGRISGTLICANVQDACYARFAPQEKVRDVTYGEDAPQARTGNGPQVMATCATSPSPP
jgi:hypothetical protein